MGKSEPEYCPGWGRVVIEDHPYDRGYWDAYSSKAYRGQEERTRKASNEYGAGWNQRCQERLEEAVQAGGK